MDLKLFDKIMRNFQYFLRLINTFIKNKNIRNLYQNISISRRINRLLKNIQLIKNLINVFKDKKFTLSHKILKIFYLIQVNIFFFFDILIYLINIGIIKNNNFKRQIFKLSSINWMSSTLIAIIINLWEINLMNRSIYEKNQFKINYLILDILRNIFDCGLSMNFYDYKNSSEFNLSMFGVIGSIIGLINIIK